MKLQKAIKKQNIKKESDILQKVENFRTTPCGFWQSDMIKRRFKKSQQVLKIEDKFEEMDKIINLYNENANINGKIANNITYCLTGLETFLNQKKILRVELI